MEKSFGRGVWNLSLVYNEQDMDGKGDSTKIEEIQNASVLELREDCNLLTDYYRTKQLVEAVIFNINEYHESVSRSIKLHAKSKAVGDDKLSNEIRRIPYHILNILGTFRAFLDHTNYSLSKKYGDKSSEIKQWEEMQSRLYDTVFAYRFIYKLRNYCQHVGMPPLQIKTYKSAENRSQKYHLLLDRDSLLEERSVWNKTLITDLKERPEDIGTGFVVNSNYAFDDNFYFVTARHCIPPQNRIYVPAFLPPKKPCVPENIYVPENDQIDLAVIKFVFKEAIPGREQNFWMGTPEILDEVMTMGYPPIQGFIDAIQVAEVSKISSFLKTTEGRITGEGQHYWGGKEDHFLISARVKGGNSGGPVINKKGEVVGVIIELLKNGEELDKLGYGVAINVHVLKKMIEKIEGKGDEIEIKELNFEIFENGFEIT